VEEWRDFIRISVEQWNYVACWYGYDWAIKMDSHEIEQEEVEVKLEIDNNHVTFH